MWETLQQGLLVTVVGMALVFATLLVVMLAIQLLDRAFRPGASKSATATAPTLPSKPSAESAPPDMGAEAAAVAVAISLARSRIGRWMALAPPPIENIYEFYDENAVGQVVNVISIQPGPGSWKSYGRVKAME